MQKFLNIQGLGERIQVNNIYCIGKNYLDHIKEFANPEVPKTPVVFCKPNTALLNYGETVSIPEINGKQMSENMQNEVEIVVVIGKDGYKIPEADAEKHILGYAIGMDLTLRDLQATAKEKGLPWTVAKGFYTSAPVSDIVLKENIKDIQNIEFGLDINGNRKQFTNSNLMIFKINYLVSYLSNIFYLSKGDLIFTGTPEGISKLNSGDKLKAYLSDLVSLEVNVK
ncbi:MAG TPA: fumarylacetoacetate hydrolase family protein [Ignavibacteria bacterium]|nr:fumarylacetoacetate hydrolase family protein [Ignavibacteria bacterium]